MPLYNPTALTNLGDAASLDVGTTTGTVAAGDDARLVKVVTIADPETADANVTLSAKATSIHVLAKEFVSAPVTLIGGSNGDTVRVTVVGNGIESPGDIDIYESGVASIYTVTGVSGTDVVVVDLCRSGGAWVINSVSRNGNVQNIDYGTVGEDLVISDTEEDARSVIGIGSSIATTGSQSWSTTREILRDVDGSRFLKTGPYGVGKTIAIMGSSTAAGAGATSSSTTWSAQLASALSSAGYTVFNVGIGAQSTATQAGRFMSDVIAGKPDYCIINTTLINEGISYDSTAALLASWKAGIMQMVRICQQYGIVPLVMSPMPQNTHANHEMHCRLLSQWLEEQSGVYPIDVYPVLTDGEGDWHTDLYNDGVHTNQAGHDAIFKAIPPGVFTTGTQWLGTPLGRGNRGVILGSDTTTEQPILYTPTYSLGSFTVSFWAGYSGAAGQALIGFNDNARLRDTGVDISLVLANGSGIPTGLHGQDGIWRHFAITYHAPSGEWKLYVNGELMGAATDPRTITSIAFLGRADAGNANFNAVGTPIRDIAIYRVPLQLHQIQGLYRGYVQRGSLELYSPCDDTATGQNYRLRNVAPTGEFLLIKTASLTPQTYADQMLTRLQAVATYDPGSISAGSYVSTTVTVTGALAEDKVYVTFSAMGSNDVTISGHVQTADTVRVIIRNLSGSSVDLPSGQLRVVVEKI